MDTVLQSVAEIHRLIPDSILFGSILLYFLTQNVAYGIFSIFIFETVISHKLISWVFSQAVGKTYPDKIDIKCRMGYKTPRYDYERMFSHDSYPSYGIFSIVSIGIYLALAMKEFSDTMYLMEESAPNSGWKSRTTVAYTLILFVIAIVFVARWKLCEESIGEMVVAFGCAFISSILFFYINKSIFGNEAMNFLGLPEMIPQTDNIYICGNQ